MYVVSVMIQQSITWANYKILLFSLTHKGYKICLNCSSYVIFRAQETATLAWVMQCTMFKAVSE